MNTFFCGLYILSFLSSYCDDSDQQHKIGHDIFKSSRDKAFILKQTEKQAKKHQNKQKQWATNELLNRSQKLIYSLTFAKSRLFEILSKKHMAAMLLKVTNPWPMVKIINNVII